MPRDSEQGFSTAPKLQVIAYLIAIGCGYLLANAGDLIILIAAVGLFVSGVINGLAAPTEVRRLVR